MAEVQPKLVHKQFNSPIGLYSEQNIKDTINREMQAVGGKGLPKRYLRKRIELDDQISSSHLANSYVFKMLQEEESERYMGYKRVAWPPTPDRKIIREFTPQPQPQGDTNQIPNHNTNDHQSLAMSGNYGNNLEQPNYHKAGPQDNNNYQNQLPDQYSHQPQQQQQQPQFNHNQNQYPYQSLSQQADQNNNNAHPQYNQQQPTEYNSHSYTPQQQYNSQGGQMNGGYQPIQQQHQQQQYHEPQQQYQPQEPHSGIVTLRKDPPYTQQPAPTVVSQPAARSMRGGSVMRGDLKWPPQDCRERMAAEEDLQRQLALGPENRPSKLQKDYSGFFAKHALSHYYPGYKIPPGTQHMLANF